MELPKTETDIDVAELGFYEKIDLFEKLVNNLKSNFQEAAKNDGVSYQYYIENVNQLDNDVFEYAKNLFRGEDETIARPSHIEVHMPMN